MNTTSAPPRPPLRLSAQLLVLVAGVACLPTVGTLGYPSSFLASPLFALFGLLLGLRQLPRSGRTPGVTLEQYARQALGHIALVTAVALAILATSSAIQGSSDYLFGSACFLLGPLPSGIFGWLCGFTAAASSERRLGRAILALTPMLVCTEIALLRLYRDPAVFAFDPFWGMFSGGIYDEDTEISATWIAYRLYNLAVASGALLALWLAFDPESGRASWKRLRARAKERRLAALASAAFILGGALISQNPTRFGFHQTAESLQRVLSGRLETPRFVLHYREGSANARDIEAIADECEFWWWRFERELGFAPRPPIDVFLFDSPWDKRELLGVGFAELAAPWRKQIYLNHEPDPHRVLPHELAHVFGAPLGDPVFGLATDLPVVNGGLIEGFAEALAGSRGDPIDQHTRAAILDRLGLRPPLETLFGWGFWSVAPARAYTTAGSFCSWIGGDLGANSRLSKLYANGGDFEATCDRPLAELEAEWVAVLRQHEPRDEDIELYRQRFERGSVFARPHAYQVARLRRRQARALAAGELSDATSLQARMLALEPELPQHTFGSIRLLGAEGAWDEALAELEDLLARSDLIETQRGAALELEGDLRFELGDVQAAGEAWRRAADRPSDESRRRRLALKVHAASQPRRLDLWRSYLRPFDLASPADVLASARLKAAEALQEHPDERALGAYLAARQLMFLGERERALALIDEFAGDAPAIHLAGFERAALELALLITARCGELGRAERLVQLLIALDPESIGWWRYRDWVERVQFSRERR